VVRVVQWALHPSTGRPVMVVAEISGPRRAPSTSGGDGGSPHVHVGWATLNDLPLTARIADFAAYGDDAVAVLTHVAVAGERPWAQLHIVSLTPLERYALGDLTADLSVYRSLALAAAVPSLWAVLARAEIAPTPLASTKARTWRGNGGGNGGGSSGAVLPTSLAVSSGRGLASVYWPPSPSRAMISAADNGRGSTSGAGEVAAPASWPPSRMVVVDLEMDDEVAEDTEDAEAEAAGGEETSVLPTPDGRKGAGAWGSGGASPSGAWGNGGNDNGGERGLGRSASSASFDGDKENMATPNSSP
jgi:hypothetical protein